eukprot:TRINITY_DN6680_c0_g1_i1.p1 TRINITY_DN6680_c0_g1~~TRINITY_DN6680_c0_g1_i1.p1  ORF type:complete len:319 (-),score=62.62 TRINITY_DN6680_c0_g1_i1:95-1051(-)
MVRAWKFLSPATGEHTLEVRSIGTPKQKVTFDGQRLESKEQQLLFVTPTGDYLRLVNDGKNASLLASKRQAVWTLFVNEQPVEEMAREATCGLRDLRSMPDGSYAIATGFASTGIKRYSVRKFKFSIAGKSHEVVVAYHDDRRLWQVALDGQLIDQERHGALEFSGHTDFEVPVGNSQPLAAHLTMSWSLLELRWTYSLLVGEVKVPAIWARHRGRFRGVEPPEILTQDAAAAMGAEQLSEETRVDSESSSDSESEGVDSRGIVQPEALPQGVSFDRESGSYQATIKDPKLNRYVCLGEYQTAEAAHARYLEAASRQN